MLKGNIGEWSEVYVLLKLLSDKILVVGDEYLEKIPDVFYPIVAILRKETTGNYKYTIHDNVVIISGGEEILRISIQKFKEKAAFLFNSLRSKKAEKTGSFSVPEIEEFMNEISCITLKAASSKKTDITIVVHDQKTNQQPALGFSIKSRLGSPSTLFNASPASNFTYEVVGQLSDEQQEIINSMVVTRGSKVMSDLKGRTQAILRSGAKLVFKEVEEIIFSNNLTLIDSLLPQIWAEILIQYYSGVSSTLSVLVEDLEAKNPLNYNKTNNHQFYSYKVKHFLTDSALGMLPTKVWTGQYDATGGYLVVRLDGEVLCYHLYKRNEFENYLLNNTKLETGSATRYKYGTIYKENNKLYFKLNLQVRFIK